MTTEEIKNTPELVDFMLDECVLTNSRAKVRKRLEEVCDMAIKALERESKLEEVIDTLQVWIATADDEYDREERGRVCGLKEALHLIKKVGEKDE